MKYRHYKGGIYEIVCEAKLEADPNVILMIYRSEEGLIWRCSSRPCSTKGKPYRALRP